MKTHILSGSHRSNSQSAKVGRYIGDRIKSRGGQVTMTELSPTTLPLWDEGMWSDDPKWKPLWEPIANQLRAADSLVVITPEYAGMAAAAIKNLFLFCGGSDIVAHKPALLVAVSSGQGGAYPIAEMRASSYKNARHLYLPEHIIVRDAEKVLNAHSSGPADDFLRKRIDYDLELLAHYETALKPLRSSGILNYKDFPFGM